MAHDGALCGHLHQRRTHVAAARTAFWLHAFSTTDLAAFGARAGQCTLHLLVGGFIDQRPHQHAFGARIADRQAHAHVFQSLHELLVDRRVRDQPSRRRAALTGGAPGAEGDATQREFQIGAGCDHHRVVAAQFQQRAAEALRDAWCEGAAHPRRAGGRDQRYARVVAQQLASIRGAEHDLRQVRGYVDVTVARRLIQQRLRGKRAQRCLLRGLPHQRVAAHQRECRVPRPHRDREVERADHADHTQRMPLLHHAVRRTFAGQRQPMQLPRQAEREVADVGHLLHFTGAFGGDLAGLECHQRGQGRLVPAQPLAETAHQLAPARGRDRAPGEEGRLRAGDGGADCRAVMRRQGGQCAAVDRRAHGQRCGRSRGGGGGARKRHAEFAQQRFNCGRAGERGAHRHRRNHLGQKSGLRPRYTA